MDNEYQKAANNTVGAAINSAQFPDTNWGNAKIFEAMAQSQTAQRSTNITISEANNGRVVMLGRKAYVCPQGTPLLEIIGQALVEAQLEK